MSILYAQGDTLLRTLTHDSLLRSYLLYIPDSYDGSEYWPLVINMHGYSLYPEQQMRIRYMNEVADTGHFLIAYPLGTLFYCNSDIAPPSGPGWNNGVPFDSILYPEKATDDVAFIENLIDSISSDFLIDQARVYATGLSNGAVMSNVLGCELSDRIAAIALVGGTAHPDRICDPIRPIPILQIHGTADPITNYENGTANRIAVQAFLDFWIAQNGCVNSPIILALPDLVTNDNSTVELFKWTDCLEEIVHFKVVDGGHTWPGDIPLPPIAGPTNMDIHASSEIWKFFKRNPHPDPTGVEDKLPDDRVMNLKVYPNPFRENLQIMLNLKQSGFVQITLLNTFGQPVQSSKIHDLYPGILQLKWMFNKTGLASGIYFLSVTFNGKRIVRSPVLLKQ